MTRAERELTLPNLSRRGILTITAAGITLADATAHSLALPDPQPAAQTEH